MGSLVTDDMVLIDANCHKSICHSLTVTGGRPVYFKPTRNGYGMIGLVPLRRFSPDYIQATDREEPLQRRGGVAGTDLCGGDQLHL